MFAKKKDLDALVNSYIQNAVIQGEATLEGDYIRGNKAAKKIIRIYKIMENDSSLAAQMLDILIKNENVNVRIWASSHALKLKIQVSEALETLQYISARKDIGVLRFSAEILLTEYSNVK